MGPYRLQVTCCAKLAKKKHGRLTSLCDAHHLPQPSAKTTANFTNILLLVCHHQCFARIRLNESQPSHPSNPERVENPPRFCRLPTRLLRAECCLPPPQLIRRRCHRASHCLPYLTAASLAMDPPALSPRRRHHSELDMPALRRISDALLLAQSRARRAAERAARCERYDRCGYPTRSCLHEA